MAPKRTWSGVFAAGLWGSLRLDARLDDARRAFPMFTSHAAARNFFEAAEAGTIEPDRWVGSELHRIVEVLYVNGVPLIVLDRLTPQEHVYVTRRFRARLRRFGPLD